jgi:putative ABC transport system permease protein
MRREVRVTGIRRLLNLPESGRRAQRDVDDEIRFHIESRVAELVAAGKTADAAAEIAAREFGDIVAARTEIARVDLRRLTRARRQSWRETIAQDVAYAARSLRKQPGFGSVVVLVLALGIGANVTMFGVVDRLLLRAPAHVVEPERLMGMAIGRAVDGELRTQSVLSYPIYGDMRSAQDAFQQVAAYSPVDLAFGRGRDARELRGIRASANFFATLGVRPAAGRFFLPEEDGNPVAPNVIVLAHAFWQRQFDGSASAIGRLLTIGDADYTIIGVAPAGFTGVTTTAVDGWIPITAGATPQEIESWSRSRHAYWLRLVGRLRPGVTPERASVIATAAIRAGALRDGESPARVEKRAQVIQLTSVLPRHARAGTADAKVAMLLAAVSVLVLLIACANVANLQLARGIARQREVAIRIALGIDRGRLIRQLVLETVLLALVAGAAHDRCHDLGRRHRARRAVHARCGAGASGGPPDPCLYRACRDRGGSRERHSARDPVEPAGGRGCPAGRRARGRAREVADAQRAARRAGRAHGRVSGRCRAVRAQPAPRPVTGVRHGAAACAHRLAPRGH